MKKLLLLLLMTRLASAVAQIPNPGFENTNWDGSISNWGNVYLISISIDTSGNTIMDSIVVDNAYFFLTNDAHTGSSAIEMRNSFNYTTGEGRAGSVSNDSDYIYSAWGSFEIVPTLIQPVQLEFYYKYFPANGDSAFASLGVFDDMGNLIGEASVLISGTTSSYTLASVPVNYTSPGIAAFYALNFTTAVYGCEPAFGTRFLVDDVSFDTVTSLDEVSGNTSLKVYPNPTSDFINIHLKNNTGNYRIYNAFGNLVADASITGNQLKIPVGHLANGVYQVELLDGTSIEKTRFVVAK